MDVNYDGSVSGMLLYAKIGEEFQPKNSFLMDGNRISVNLFNLNFSFEEIKAQLESIVADYL